MILSKHLKSRFCKDNGLSISVFEEPYFSERLVFHGFMEKYNKFCELIENKFGGDEENYFSYSNKLKEDIVNFVKESEAYTKLNSLDKDEIEKYVVNTSVPVTDVYKGTCIGKRFISIDISKANFSSLVYFGKQNDCRFFDSYDWVDFLKNFTDCEYFHNLKNYRQVVFGECNGKRLSMYEKYIINSVKEKIEAILDISDRQVAFCNDELIYNVDGLSLETINFVRQYVEEVLSKDIPLHFEYFRIGNAKDTKAYIKQVFDENGNVLKYVYKSGTPFENMLAKKKIENIPVTENDLVFVAQNGYLAKYFSYPVVEIIGFD